MNKTDIRAHSHTSTSFPTRSVNQNLQTILSGFKGHFDCYTVQSNPEPLHYCVANGHSFIGMFEIQRQSSLMTPFLAYLHQLLLIFLLTFLKLILY